MTTTRKARPGFVLMEHPKLPEHPPIEVGESAVPAHIANDWREVGATPETETVETDNADDTGDELDD